MGLLWRAGVMAWRTNVAAHAALGATYGLVEGAFAGADALPFGHATAPDTASHPLRVAHHAHAMARHAGNLACVLTCAAAGTVGGAALGGVLGLFFPLSYLPVLRPPAPK